MSLHVALFVNEPLVRDSLRERLLTAGHRASVLDVDDLSPGPLGRIRPHVLLLDLDTRRIGPTRALPLMAQALPELLIVLLASPTAVSRAIRALQAGAFDYIERPLLPEKIAALLTKAARHLSLARQNCALRSRLGRRCQIADLVGAGDDAGTAIDQSELLGSAPPPIWLAGERGTGKLLLARLLHERAGGEDEGFHVVDVEALRGPALETALGAARSRVRGDRGGSPPLDDLRRDAGRRVAPRAGRARAGRRRRRVPRGRAPGVDPQVTARAG